MLSVTISRASLGLGDLTVSNDPTSGLWLPEDGLGRAARTWRRQYASSPFTHGNVQTRATLEHSSIPLTIYAQASTSAALRARQVDLENALGQWNFDLTVTEDGQALTFDADCADVAWGEFDSGMTRAHLARATVTIPCYPVGA